MEKKKPFDNMRFSLGIEGERWEGGIPGLFVPMKETTDPIRGVVITKIVFSAAGVPDRYTIISDKKWIVESDLVMVISIVRNMTGQV